MCAHVNKEEKRTRNKQTKKKSCQNGVPRLGECATMYLSKVLPSCILLASFFLRTRITEAAFALSTNQHGSWFSLVSFFCLLFFFLNSSHIASLFSFSLFSFLTRRAACCCKKGKRRRHAKKDDSAEHDLGEWGWLVARLVQSSLL